MGCVFGRLIRYPSRILDIPIPLSAKSDGYVLIEMKLLNPVSPKALGMGDDTRELGIGLTKLEVR